MGLCPGTEAVRVPKAEQRVHMAVENLDDGAQGPASSVACSSPEPMKIRAKLSMADSPLVITRITAISSRM